MKIGTKNYLVKYYSSDYQTLLGAIADARVQFYTAKINSGPGEFVFEVERSLQDWTTLGDLEINTIIELWVNDTDTNDYIRVYSGYISNIRFREKTGATKSVIVSCLGFVSRLGLDVYKDGTTTTISESAEDPSNIFKNILLKLKDTANGNIPYLNFSEDTIVDTALSVDAKFESDTYAEALEKALSLCPANWYWKLGEDNLFYLKQKPSVATHNFSPGHIDNLEIDYSMEQIVNGVLIWDNDTSYRYISDPDSIAKYGRRILKMNAPGADNTDAMDKIAKSKIGEEREAKSIINLSIADNNEFEAYGDLAGYDIESIKPGDTCRLTGISEQSGAFLSINMSIRKVTYYPTKADLEVEINRNDLDKYVVDFKKQQGQIDNDGIPTSYTVA